MYINSTMSSSSLDYWVLLVPLSMGGTVSNMILVWIWSRKRYKFNRFIIMAIAVSNSSFLCSYHSWKQATRWAKSYQLALSVVVFTLRLYAVMLYVYLSIIQYFYFSTTYHHHWQPRLISKRRVVYGFIVAGLWVGIFRTARYVFALNTSEGQTKRLSSMFMVVTLVMPNLVQAYFVVALILCVRRCRTLFVARLLGQKTLAALSSRDQGIRNQLPLSLPPGLAEKIRAHRIAILKNTTEKLIRRLSAPSTSLVSDIPLHERNIMTPGTFRRLAKNVKLEMQLTKAIIIMCIPPSLIYTIVFLVQAVIQMYDVALFRFTFTLIDILQFINFGLPLYALMLCVPSFRRLVIRIMCRLSTQQSMRRRRKSKKTTTQTPTDTTQSGTTTPANLTTTETDTSSTSFSEAEEEDEGGDEEKEKKDNSGIEAKHRRSAMGRNSLPGDGDTDGVTEVRTVKSLVRHVSFA